MFIVPTIIGTEPPCSSARKKDVERNRHSFPLTKIVAVLLFIEEIEEENKKAPKLFKVTVDTDVLERLRGKQSCKGKYPLNDANIANEVRLIEVYLADKVWDLVELAYMDQR